MYTPRLGSHPVGGNLSFECEDGFTLRGSAVRQCRPNGMWDGETAVCDNGGECPDPWLHGGRGSPGSPGTRYVPREHVWGQGPGVSGAKIIFPDFGQLRSIVTYL